MASILFTNFARSQLAATLLADDLSLTVETGHGARFPSPGGEDYFYLVLENAALDREIVKCTGREVDTLTIVRAQDNTTARGWNAGDIVALRFVAAAIADAVTGTAKLAGATFTGAVAVPAGASGAQVPQAQEVALLATTQLGGNRNKLINGGFEVNQRAATSVADDTYCLDRFYVLTESGNVTVAQVTDPESGAPFGIRLTQPDATAKRMGFAQIIESKNIRQYASTAMNLSARLRLSTAAKIRYAVIEHTGTADEVTSDVVNDWASVTFTPSNFFIAGVNIISTGTIAPGAATWGEVSDWDALGASVKNVIVFIWTESQVAQDVTLDCSRIQYEPGVVATPFEWRMNERILCERYYEAGRFRFVLPIANADVVASYYIHHPWRVVKRSAPAVSGTESYGTFAAASVTIFGAALGRSDTVANRITDGTYAASSEL